MSGRSHNAQTERNRTLLLSGHGVTIRVEQDALLVSEGSLSSSQKPIVHTLHRGQRDVSKIILLTTSGIVSLDALAWCNQEAICVQIKSYDGSMLYSLTAGICPDVQVQRKEVPS